MSRIEECRSRFLAWATWKKSSGNVAEDPAAAAIDDIVAGLPAALRATLIEIYVIGGDVRHHTLRLGCPEATIVRRLGQADRLLMDQLSLRRAARRREDEQIEMAARLGSRSAAAPDL